VVDETTVGLGLTPDAAAYARDGLAASFRDRFAAILAVGEAVADGQGAPRARHGVVDARIDLVLHGPVLSPANSHVLILVGGDLSLAQYSEAT
jgi:hypothetical protein